MQHLETLHIAGHEEVVVCRDDQTGLQAIIAIHDTTLGPAVGGTRMRPYPDRESALADVLRLSRAMTYKAAAAELDFGGGKAVILGDPQRDKSEALLRSFGRFVDRFGGRFMTGEDVGTTAADMEIAARETPHVVYPRDELRDKWQTGFLTAYGVLHGIRCCARTALGSERLEGVAVALQGVGKVGEELARMLAADGARVAVADLDERRAAEVAARYGAQLIAPDRVSDAEAEVFAPCALGGVLNDQTIPRLRCRIVAGAANNQLEHDRHGAELWRRGILYAPDYVINAGGLISALYEMALADRQTVMARTAGIEARLRLVFDRSHRDAIPTNEAADRLVEERLRAAREQGRPTAAS